MQPNFRRLAATLTIVAGTLAPVVAVAPAAAQPAPQRRFYGDRGARVLRGQVASFSAYRLLLADGRGGRTTQVDLDENTRIIPVGTTLTPGMRVAVAGYWSKGVYIARRIALR